MGEREEMVVFLQRALGLALVGTVVEEAFFVCYGEGHNGKSTLMKTVMTLLGVDSDGYACQIRPEVFIGSKPDGENATPVLLSLKGRRFVVASEPDAGTVLSDGAVKMLCSRDPINARGLYRAPVTFMPSHTLFVLTNHIPQIRDFSTGARRRLKLIPFEVQIPENERHPAYEEVLLQEAEGILAWMAEGCRLWVEDGRNLRYPAPVVESSDEFVEDQDELDQFISETFDIGGNGFLTTHEIYACYEDWLSKRGMRHVPSFTKFSRDLKGREQSFGIKSDKRHGGRKGYTGLQLRMREEEQLPAPYDY